MEKNDPASTEFPPAENVEERVPPTDPTAPSPTKAGRIRKRIRWLLLRAAALVGTSLLMLGLLTAFAGWYTSRPVFCRSCHIMEPYYVSWQESTHRNVSCIKCHFPPGVGEKVRGKLLGLVQLTKYVTRSESPRPTAEIPDASCLRSGCHETRTLAGRVDFHGIDFDHAPHLLKLRRGKKLRCTSCHSQIVQGSHMTVTTSTCFLCHFKDTPFNEGLGACTRCHEIPEKEFDLGGGMVLRHRELIQNKGVECANCHGDLVRGNGAVPHERCQVCHNRQNDLARIGDHDFIHKKHVTEHKVDCLECHLEIQHSLDEQRVVHAASDCKSCHPDHHHEQIDMLQGVGGKTVVRQVGGMLLARITCPACHRQKDISPTGTVLWQASTQTCTQCHDGAAAERLRKHHRILKEALSEIESEILRVRKALESSKFQSDQKTATETQLKDLQDDLNFLRAGNGIHNVHYANSLSRAVVERLSSLCRALGIAAPNVDLPDKADLSE